MSQSRNGGDYYPPVGPQQEQVSRRVVFAAIGATSSAPLDIGGFRSGMVFLTDEFNTDAIELRVSDTADGTFTRPYASGAVISTSAYTAAQTTWNVLPAEVMAAGFLRIITNVGVAAPASLPTILKT